MKKIQFLREAAREAFDFSAEQEWFANVTSEITQRVDCKL